MGERATSDKQGSGLRLEGRDAADLAVISACLQDALVMVSDIAYFAEERRFILVANRFRWEAGTKPPGAAGSRTTASLTVEGVRTVGRRGIDRQAGEAMLSLLALRQEGEALRLDFSGGAAIRLDLEPGAPLGIRLQDLGEPWPAGWQPHHEG